LCRKSDRMAMSGHGRGFASERERRSASDSWEDALDFAGEGASRQSARARGRGRVAMASDDVDTGAAGYGGRGREPNGRGRGRLSGAAATVHIEGEDDGRTEEGEGASQGRGRGRGRGRLGLCEGGRAPTKDKNFIPEEERQLTRSVMAISQDPIVGNQQHKGAFWERIAEHYDLNRRTGSRGARSLESKWGVIKHDIGKFIMYHKQIVALNKTGVSAADIVKMAKDLYRLKHVKGHDFIFEHCWVLVREFPKWADGWASPRSSSSATPPKQARVGDPQALVESGDTGSVSEAATSFLPNAATMERPGGTKAAKDQQKTHKQHEGAGYAQAKATEAVAAAAFRKAALLEEQNLFLLMTTGEGGVIQPAAQEFLRLRQEEELEKLKDRLAERKERQLELRRQKEHEALAATEADRRREEAEQQERLETNRQLQQAAKESAWCNGEPAEGAEPNDDEEENDLEEGGDYFEGDDGEPEAVGLGGDPDCDFSEEQEGMIRKPCIQIVTLKEARQLFFISGPPQLTILRS
jgi:hypothetical protein